MAQRKAHARFYGDEIERLKELKAVVYGDSADDVPHAMFVMEAAEYYAEEYGDAKYQ